MKAILSVDGGGIRGIIPATFLVEFEKRTGKSTCELFDLIAGTSTGGLLAAGLTLPDTGGRPKYTAAQMLAAYFEDGGAIFHKSLCRTVMTLGGLIRPIYSPRNLERVLERYLGDARLHMALTEVLIPAYDMESSTPWFFKTSFARQNRSPANDPLLTQVVRATTAAPTYFPPLAMAGHCMIDGGVFAGNPALCALAQARNMYPDETEFLVVSLGTGQEMHHLPCGAVCGWGKADWAKPISTVMLNASSASVNYQMRALVGAKNYARFQVLLDKDAAAMDDASPENMRRLEAIAQQAVRQHTGAIDRLCRQLLQNTESLQNCNAAS
ncbi:MAG TPA: patatin-like phospholipase family protein [Candidatus Acidoferrum sp.]|nr:patatin-like phospholipase family protein [Candidatus Acidoferrum sp.]